MQWALFEMTERYQIPNDKKESQLELKAGSWENLNLSEKTDVSYPNFPQHIYSVPLLLKKPVSFMQPICYNLQMGILSDKTTSQP